MNGVVHVGAHRGEEVPKYLSEGRSPVICFEPQPLKWECPREVDLVQAALSDRTGSLAMRIPHHLHDTPDRDTMSASGFPLIAENAKANGWTPTPWDTLTVPVLRFDEWANCNGFEKDSCASLYIDVQGMELQVLRGFGVYLQGFEELVIECSSPPLYDGGASAKEVEDYLLSEGFVRISPILRHGDIQFKKEK